MNVIHSFSSAGFDLLADVTYHKKRREFLQKRDELNKSKEDQLFGKGSGGKEEEEGGLFEAAENGDSTDLFQEEKISQPFTGWC